MGKTLVEKLWERHVVASLPGGIDLLYIDLQLLHEGTSPQAFDALREAGRRVRRPELSVGTVDHRIPTVHSGAPVDELTVRSVEAMVRNCRDFGIRLFQVGDPNQGIVHVIGPELGLTRPGITLVCGDSHTCTHGALGALAFGIGTTEVEHVLATQTLAMARPKAMEVRVEGALAEDVAAKDVALAIIRATGVGGGIGHVIEYRGSAIRDLSMEGRLTVCNMSVEAGARSGLIASDDTTFRYLEGRPYAPKGKQWEEALEDWRSLATDRDAAFDKSVAIDAAAIRPSVTWGTNPSQSMAIDGLIPDPNSFDDPIERAAAQRALEYMGLTAGTPITDLKVDAVFIGSCTNARIEDLRAAARVLEGRSVKPGVRALCVPGSRRIVEQARVEGFDETFRKAGFQWGDPGCSMCSGIGGYLLKPGERSASTSNRNFEGRQGPGGRTHLVSPATAAATAVAGRFCSPTPRP